MLAIRYPPYVGKMSMFRRLYELKPNFDREGRVQTGWLGWLFSFGGGESKGGLVKYLIVFIGKV